MSEQIGIRGRLRQINTHIDRPVTTADGRVVGPGRVELEDVEPGRTAEIKAGNSNIGFGYVLIFDFKGDSDFITKEENDRTDNVRVEVETVHANGRVEFTTYTVGQEGDETTEKEGTAPFEGIRAQKDEDTHLNLIHLFCTGGRRIKVRVRQVRETAKGAIVSPWIGANDGQGFRVGRQ